jgi:hypothetical protein
MALYESEVQSHKYEPQLETMQWIRQTQHNK